MMRMSVVSAGAAVVLLVAAALVCLVHVTHRSALIEESDEVFAVPTFYLPTEALAVADAPYRLAGYEVPGTKHSSNTVAYNPGPQRLEGYWPGPTHSWPPSQKAPMSQLGYLTEAVDPAWVTAGQLPLDYFQAQSPIQEKELEFWPGVKREDVIPDRMAPSPPLDNIDHWVKNTGWGGLRMDENGTAYTKHGFMATNVNCSDGGTCQNSDICVNSRCVPAIFNGTQVAQEQAELSKRLKAKQQQLMVNMVYEHHEMPPLAFGTGAVHDDGALPEVSSDAKSAMKAAGKELAGDTTGIWYDPYSGSYGNDGLKAKDAQLSQQVQALREIAGMQREEMARLEQHRAEQAHLQRLHAHQALLQAQAQMQQLAMGGGTPLDLTFGVGKDGEPPYHMETVAESVRNGILDANAPEALPYARVKGSGTSDQIASVGYLSPLAPAPAEEEPPAELDGTVA